MNLESVETQLKLSKEALTTRNRELNSSEENNCDLLALLDNYDNKLEELNE